MKEEYCLETEVYGTGRGQISNNIVNVPGRIMDIRKAGSRCSNLGPP